MAPLHLDLDDLLPPELVRVAGDGDDAPLQRVPRAAALDGGATVLLYFSAHWCPPCRAFTPVLASAYSALRARGVPVAVVFVSSDRDAAAFAGYLRQQRRAGGAWLAVPFEDAAARGRLARALGVAGIPTLAVVAPGGEVLAADARAAAAADPEGRRFPWRGAGGGAAPPGGWAALLTPRAVAMALLLFMWLRQWWAGGAAGGSALRF